MSVLLFGTANYLDSLFLLRRKQAANSLLTLRLHISSPADVTKKDDVNIMNSYMVSHYMATFQGFVTRVSETKRLLVIEAKMTKTKKRIVIANSFLFYATLSKVRIEACADVMLAVRSWQDSDEGV